MTALPIDDVLPDVLRHLQAAGAVVLRAATGAGKTTRVPPAVAGITRGQLLLIEPRRVAARAAARRMAFEDGSNLGDRFGYSVRFDHKATHRTRVVACTPGVALRRLQEDPFLENIVGIIFDEFHERGLETDLLLGMARLIRQTVKPELLVVVMSATIDTTLISNYLGGAPTVTSEGRSFPVEVRYRPKRPEVAWPEAVASAIETATQETPGDVLAFLPGVGEIRRTAELLTHLEPDFLLLPLHGELSPEEQDKALLKHPRRKIVLSTNVAETSVTVEGITAVVDSGLARQQEFDTAVGMDRLELRPISRASADQRAGRAGRTQPGTCYRLWDEVSHRARRESQEPEIARVDLSSAVLMLAAIGETDFAQFPWLDAPRPEALALALNLLTLLGAWHDGKLTELGDRLIYYPVHPRLGRLLLEGERLGVPGRAALVAAMLSERDPFRRDRDAKPIDTESDVLDRIEALEEFEATGRLSHSIGSLQRGSARQLLQARDQLARLLLNSQATDPDEAILRAIYSAYPDRFAKRRAVGDSRAKLVGGRGAKLGPMSGVQSELFVAVDVDAGGADAWVRMASGVRREWLDPEFIITTTEVFFDETTGKLAARRYTSYVDLILDEQPMPIPDDDRAAEALTAAAIARLAEVLPDAESAAGRFLTRLKCLKSWWPELDLPTIETDWLTEHLPSLCKGRRSLAELRAAPWLDLLRGVMTYQQLQTLDREAPETLEVPTGSQIALTYELGRPPILAVRIQELFGLAETPRLAGGRVKVLLHLLAPNYRPQQVTDDLASFWANGYPVVRKDLRGRYPKHSWPDNPLEAEAIRGPKKRPPVP
ncbi:MAG: ATP-dependent helicase HrpB [Fimbriiglobus sp.]